MNSATLRQYLLLICTWLSLIQPAAAVGLAVCNQTFDIANVAIATSDRERFVSKGWWAIAPNRCADLLTEKLENRYIYLFAIDVKGRVLIEGTQRFCIRPRQFEINSSKDCLKRGHTQADFREIDTQSAEGWTVFLTLPDEQNSASDVDE